MNDIESLKFELKEKEKKLENIDMSHFALNKDIMELINEITLIKDKIKTMEENAE